MAARLGGPIFKNKLFFFGAYQREPITQQASGVSYTAPTGAGLTQIAALPGASAFVINLLRRQSGSSRTQRTETQTVLGQGGNSFRCGFTGNAGRFRWKRSIRSISIICWESRNQFRYRFSSDNIGTEPAR